MHWPGMVPGPVTLGVRERSCEARRSMDWDDYLRQQAAMYRQLAEKTEDAFIKQELIELAAVCEEVANNIEDRLASG
jgi:methionine synthase II (cobalamin-independent)